MSIPLWHKQDFMAHVSQDFDVAGAHMVIWWGSKWRNCQHVVWARKRLINKKPGSSFRWNTCTEFVLQMWFQWSEGLKRFNKLMLKSWWKLLTNQPQTRKHFLARLESPWRLLTQIQCCVICGTEIPKKHLGCKKMRRKQWDFNYPPQLVFRQISEPSTGYFGDGVSIRYPRSLALEILQVFQNTETPNLRKGAGWSNCHMFFVKIYLLHESKLEFQKGRHIQ